MARMHATVLVLLLSAALLRAQEFEVAAIKPGSGLLRIQFQDGGRFVGANVPLRTLVQIAFELQPKQLVGGPSWIDSVGFDIQAKGDDLSTPADLRRMLAALLAQRFGLQFHREQREINYFALTVKDMARAKARILPPEPGDPHAFSSGYTWPGIPNRIRVRNHTMPQFAGRIGPAVDRVVVDETGWPGSFTAEIEAPQDDLAGNIFAVAWGPALNEIGLKLDSRRGPVEVFVIDEARLPSEN